MYEYIESEYKKNNIETINFTSSLQKAAKDNLENGKLIFWKDDTHWNKLGIKSAMQILREEIN